MLKLFMSHAAVGFLMLIVPAIALALGVHFLGTVIFKLAFILLVIGAVTVMGCALFCAVLEEYLPKTVQNWIRK